MDESDLRVRLAAFTFLDERRKVSSDLFDRRELQRGFVFDGERVPLGTPTVPNGIALCSVHHAAFDAHLMGVRPGYEIEVRRDVLEESDGPMLIHGLQGFHGKLIRVPSRQPLRPDAHLLEIRYDLFRQASRTA